MPFLFTAPTSLREPPSRFAAKSVGVDPKSPSVTASAAGTCQDPTMVSVSACSSTIDKAYRSVSTQELALLVVRYSSLASVSRVGELHTPTPRHPSGTRSRSCSMAPVETSNLKKCPAVPGHSPTEAVPIYISSWYTTGEPQMKVPGAEPRDVAHRILPVFAFSAYMWAFPPPTKSTRVCTPLIMTGAMVAVLATPAVGG